MSLSALRVPRSALLALLVLAYLWLRLLNHLRVEWTVNEQYAYGWAVPFLCGYLLWRQWRGVGVAASPSPLNGERAGVRGGMEEAHSQARESRNIPTPHPQSLSPLRGEGSRTPTAMIVLTLAFLFTRWIEEANPDWRLVSWALALEVIAFTLVAIHAVGGAARLRQLAFPILFFLVAVPWPTSVEQSVIQVLTRSIVTVTVEILHACGVAAVPHGNVIETAGGLVDIDEACSGIRSLQAVLMLALFFGELRRFKPARRVSLCLSAFALACLFNLARTVTLSLVAAARGADAVHAWHDPAGIAILVGCFIGVWAVAAWMGQRNSTPRRSNVETQDDPPSPPRPGRGMEGEVSHSGDSPLSVFSFRNFSFGQSLVLALLLLAGEVAVQLWYASAPRAVTADWRVEMPRANPSFKQAELPKTAVKLLRFNEAQSGAWQNADGTRWQMIYLRWNPGRTAVHLARSHTPETCLPAAGRHPRSITEISPIPAGPVQMPFRCFTTGSESQPLFVFYSLWEDGAPRPSLAKQQLTWRTRFEAALERRRNPGQRVLQFGVWGARDAVHAEELLRAELPTLIAKAESGNGEGRKLK